MDDTASLQKIKDLITKKQEFGVLVGKNPTVDEMAAALSIYLTLKAMNKKVSIASPTQPIVELSSLVGIDQVKPQFESTGGDLVVSFPYREGEIEKVSYTIDNGYLNIVVKAAEQGLTFNERDVKYTRGGGALDGLFVVGTSRLSDLGALFNPETLKNTPVINIDNHTDNQGFGDIVLVSSIAPSVCEQVANLIFYLGMDPDIDTAQNLLNGILAATDNFQNPKTDYMTLEMAAQLMKRGAIRMRKDFYQPQSQPQPLSQPQPRQSRMPQISQTPTMPQPFMPKNNLPRPNQQADRKPPADWLTPKVYSGKSPIE